MPSSFERAAWRDARVALRTLLVSLAVCLGFGLASCSGHESRDLEVEGGDAPSEKASAVAPRPLGTMPFDPATIAANARLAFRADHDGWTASAGALDVRATLSGFSVEPRRVVPGGALPANGDATVERGVPLTLTSAGAGRGSREPRDGRRAELGSDGGLAIDRGDIVEHLKSSTEGVEQSFSLEHRPAGEGDLEIEIRVSGQVYYGWTESGHHFFDPSTGLGVRYGLAKWIDATGTTTEVPVRWEEGSLVLAVAADVVEGSSYPAVLDPVVSAEFGIDAAVPSLGDHAQFRPLVGWDGTNYLVVWEDSFASTRNIVGSRVTPAGAVLDPGGFFVGGDLGQSGNWALGWNGSSHLVAWNSYVSGGNPEVHSARVHPDGTVDSAPAILNSDTGAYTKVAVGSNGSDFLVVWSDFPNGALGGSTLKYRRVGANGAGLGAAVTFYGDVEPAVAFDGTNYMVVFRTSHAIYGGRVSQAGAKVDLAKVLISGAGAYASEPAIAFDGTNYLVAWQDSQLGTVDIVGTRLSTSTTVLDPAGLAIYVGANTQSNVRLAFDGTNYLALWDDGSTEVHGRRVTTAGALLDGAGFVVAGAPATSSATRSGVACAGGECFVAWSDARSGSSEVYATRVNGANVVDPAGLFLTPSVNSQYAPDVAWSGTDYLVVWQDSRTDVDYDIYGARIDPQGNVLDPAGFAITTGAGDQELPKITHASWGYFVAWHDLRASSSGDVYGARVSDGGVVLDGPTGVPIYTGNGGQHAVDVGTSGSTAQVIWTDTVGGVYVLFGARVDGAGVVLDSPPHTLLTSTLTSRPETAIAFDGTNYLVALGVSAKKLSAARVDTLGNSLDPSGFLVTSNGASPSVAFDGANYLVVYKRTTGIYGTRVTTAAAVLDPNGISISTAAGPPDMPSVTFDGTSYYAVWRDMALGKGRLSATSISTSGVVAVPDGAVIATNAYDHQHPSLAGDGAGHTLLVYDRLDNYPPYQTSRAHARFVTGNLPSGTPCTQAAECASGYCIDAVCCATVCGPANGATDTTDCAACSVAAGAAVDGTCAATTGNTCDDADACTGLSACQAGTCVGSQPVICVALDPCHAPGTCSAATGLCSNPAVPDGTGCDDGSACTQSDVCQAGVCTGQNVVVCPAATVCHVVGACDPSTGTCPSTVVPDGTSCLGGNLCMSGETCQAGTCAGGVPVSCPAPDQCHTPGVCNPGTGVCANPVKADGAACDDGNPCTTDDVCTAGICAGAEIECAAEDACHVPGVCDPVTGNCSSVNAPSGTSCDDGDLCTVSDKCQSGVCSGSPKSCPAATDCRDVGACDSATGQCALDDQPDGTACGEGCTEGGACESGVCKNAVPKVCPPLDECHVAGVCDEATGACDNPPAPDGTPCGAGVCVAGVCGGSEPTTASTGAGAGGDGPTGDGAAGEDGGGCGCHVTGAPSAPRHGWLLIAGFALLRRRRPAPAARPVRLAGLPIPPRTRRASRMA